MDWKLKGAKSPGELQRRRRISPLFGHWACIRRELSPVHLTFKMPIIIKRNHRKTPDPVSPVSVFPHVACALRRACLNFSDRTSNELLTVDLLKNALTDER